MHPSRAARRAACETLSCGSASTFPAFDRYRPVSVTAPARPDVYFRSDYGRAECRDAEREWLSIDRLDGAFQLPLILRAVNDRVRDAISPYGYSGAFADPAVPTADVARAWASATEELRDRRVVSAFLRHSPLVPQAAMDFEHVPVVRDHPTVAVDVRDTETAWAQLEGRCRTAIRKARRHGATVDIRPATADDLVAGSPFRELYGATMRRHTANDFYFFPDEYYTDLHLGLGDDLLIAQGHDADGVALSAALFLRHGRFLHYHLSGSSPKANRLGLNSLVLWEAAVHAGSSGATTLHLGGGTSADDHLYRFKASFGPRRLSYTATGVIIDPDTYRELASATTSDAHSSFFPAYRTGGG